ncbi:MAG: SagB/ThcOx family dehydrogenase [Burkholderiales bacterium]|nr:MAG: SagB/ThcOx family dehydrogenase [Burkholderiales bacterium]
MDPIRLPPPRTESAFALERALDERRTVRSFGVTPLSLQAVGQLLWAAQGVTTPDGLRTAPSAGALYPLELTLVAGAVSGLQPGLYRYRPATHALAPLGAGDRRAALAGAALNQTWLQQAPATVVFGAVESRTRFKYGGRSTRYVHIEVGHAAQNLLLQARALGLGAGLIGAFDDAKVAEVLGMPEEEEPLYLVPVGSEGP